MIKRVLIRPAHSLSIDPVGGSANIGAGMYIIDLFAVKNNFVKNNLIFLPKYYNNKLLKYNNNATCCWLHNILWPISAKGGNVVVKDWNGSPRRLLFPPSQHINLYTNLLVSFRGIYWLKLCAYQQQVA